MIATKFHADFTADNFHELGVGKTPMRRKAASEDVTNLVAFLATDEAAFIAGNNVDINGGLAFS